MTDAPRGPEPATGGGQADAIGRLDRAIQEPLYRMGWTSLRPIQAAAIRAIDDGDGDLIVSAQTAAGKTEAAFLPILSKIVPTNAEPGVKAIYAGPLKALINDQFLRLERLCEAAAIPVHKWHGDVNAAAKKRLLETPSGVLLITPESIESLLINHGARLDAVFGPLGFVVIDEMHAFLADERGAQLRSVLARVARRAKNPVRLVGLSATLGDPEAARRWLRPRDPGRVTIVTDPGEGKVVKVRVNGYLDAPKDDGKADRTLDHALLSDVYEAFAGQTALIFGESKRRIEECAAFAVAEADRRGVTAGFRVHHGSLSRREREESEEALRSDRPTATFCSSTLEMGIDVGNVRSVGQVGAPGSVASLVQRLGRSGRKSGEPRVLRMFLEEDTPGPAAPLADRLYPNLLRGIACVELMLARWSEPPEVDRIHASTLVQQILSTIAETGGMAAEGLFDVLVTRGAFVAVDRPMFVAVLRSLGAADLVEQAPEGDLILGAKGEVIARDRAFYAAFSSPEALKVVADGRELGQIPFAPGLGSGSGLALAGRSWRVRSVDRRRGVVEVEPGAGEPFAAGRGGFAGGDVHPKVHAAIRDLLRSDVVPAYLDETAASMLASARALATESGALDGDLIADGPRLAWFPWAGTRVHRTLRLLAQTVGLKPRDLAHGLAIGLEGTSPSSARSVLLSARDNPPPSESLAALDPDRAREKYDPYLGDDLLCRIYARDGLDLPGALAAIGGLGEPSPEGDPQR